MHSRLKLSKSQEKVNNLMYMNDIKLFAIDEKELENLIQTVRIYTQEKGIKLGREKCAMLVMKSGKRHMTVGVELLNQQVLRTLGEKETYKYLGILEAGTKLVEIKENNFKRVVQKNQKITRDKTL